MNQVWTIILSTHRLARADFENCANRTPRDNIFAAFRYYLDSVNNGERPFILYGHSQGAHLVSEIATALLGSRQYARHNQNHIITYAIGASVTQKQLDRNPRLKFSQCASDTGVIVSWNATAPGEVESGAYEHFGTWKPGALVTNPLTWNTDETAAPAVPFTGSALGPDGFYPVEGFADAVVDNERGILIVRSADESQFLQSNTKASKYHICDVSFFRDSIRQNIVDRIAAYKPGTIRNVWKKKPGHEPSRI